MKIVKGVLLRNRETRGRLSMFIGGVFLGLCIIFSEGYEPSVGLFGSLPYMYVEVVSKKEESKEVPSGWIFSGVQGTVTEVATVRDEIRIPFKYLLLVSSLFVSVGVYTFLFVKNERVTSS